MRRRVATGDRSRRHRPSRTADCKERGHPVARQLDSPELVESISRSAKVVAERTAKGVSLTPPSKTFLRGESGAIVDLTGTIIAPPKEAKP